ncbi:MAG: cation transporter [Chloroflexi bacterium]|nr:cation transporter [Chloroflexota bacterium]
MQGVIVVQPIVYIDLGVGGMTCDDCVRKVTDTLESVPGVNRASVDLEGRSAVVEASPEVGPEALTDAVRAARPYNAFVRRVRTSRDG